MMKKMKILIIEDLNTSYVNVNRACQSRMKKLVDNLNTSYVNVNPM